MNTMRISNIPEMESSVSVALSYSLSSESVEESDECSGGSDCVSPQTEKAQGPLKGFIHTTALSAINIYSYNIIFRKCTLPALETYSYKAFCTHVILVEFTFLYRIIM